MKLVLTAALSALLLSAPAFAETAAPSSAPASKAGKTDFTKPFVNDRLGQPLPSKQPPDRPHVELHAGPGPINR
jgi:hypothetical protein